MNESLIKDKNLVSVIIPTYNRFKYLLNAIESIKNQTYENIEIIVVNDKSTQEEYYTHNFEGCKVIHLEKNSKEILGFACAGYVRNQGIKVASGDYICFLDDDDYFLPHKIQTQIETMINENFLFSATEGLIGNGPYNIKNKYPLYNGEYYRNYILNKLNLKDYPNIIDLTLLNIHNIIINSSVMIKKCVLLMYPYPHLSNGNEDYTLWKNLLKEMNCLYIKEPCLYYDLGHGDGQLY
jgi:glycosyltransferase involved in cell wall biosynthesis